MIFGQRDRHCATRPRFALLQLQFGHGYLMASFLRPSQTGVPDEYGATWNTYAYPWKSFE